MNVSGHVDAVAEKLHARERVQAANIFLAATGQREVQTERDALYVLNTMLRWCLDKNRKDLAAKLLWTPAQFTPEPRSVKMIWEEVEDNAFVLLQGASSMGKTYTAGVNFFLEWLRDPQYTLVRCVGPSEDHLQANLFTHLVMLHSSASIPLPGKVQDLFIGLDPKNKKGGILGTVIPQGRKAAGRVQGSKRAPRPRPHKIFGDMSRLFILVDELEKVPAGLYQDLENVVSNLISEDDRGFKIVGCYNPQDTTLKPYQLAEPKQGWASFDPDEDEVWDSKAGYRVVRLDAEKSENVLQRRVVYPGLQTSAGLDKLAQVSGGKDSPGYQTFGRGCYPKQGNSYTLIVETGLNERVATPIWLDSPTITSGIDLALEGGDHIRHAWGKFGNATGVRFPDGKMMSFVDTNGNKRIRPVMSLVGINPLAKGDTIQSAAAIKEALLAVRADPAWTLLDRTGVGAGIHDVLRTLWSPSIAGLNYSESATETKILIEDTILCRERFGTGRVVSELWFAAQTLLDHGYIWIEPEFTGVTKLALWKQLCGRRYAPGKNNRVESKKEYKERGNPSPDEADSFTLWVHQIRKMAGAVFSITRSGEASKAAGDAPAPSLGYSDIGNVLAFVDPTNRIDHFED